MLFIDNKYTRIYYSIISNAQSRILPNGTYTEKHHIIPKSLGGDNSTENLATLTAREHFICHWLLTKMVTNTYKWKMTNALGMMRASNLNHNRYTSIITSRIYANLKGMYRLPDSVKQKISTSNKGRVSPNKGKVLSSEQRDKLSAATKGKPKSEETKQRMKEAWKTRGKVSEETKQKMSAAKKGRPAHNKGKAQPEWVKQKLRDTRKGQNDGKKWFTDGTTTYFQKECPPGCIPGRIKKK